MHVYICVRVHMQVPYALNGRKKQGYMLTLRQFPFQLGEAGGARDTSFQNEKTKSSQGGSQVFMRLVTMIDERVPVAIYFSLVGHTTL